MELSFAIMFLGATFGVAAYLVSADFRAVVRDYRHYDWRILVGILFALLLASWFLPLVVIKDTLSPAFVILRDVHTTSLRPAPYRPDASYFDYFRGLLESFAVYSSIASVILTWLIHCMIAIFRRKRGLR